MPGFLAWAPFLSPTAMSFPPHYSYGIQRGMCDPLLPFLLPTEMAVVLGNVSIESPKWKASLPFAGAEKSQI